MPERDASARVQAAEAEASQRPVDAFRCGDPPIDNNATVPLPALDIMSAGRGSIGGDAPPLRFAAPRSVGCGNIDFAESSTTLLIANRR